MTHWNSLSSNRVGVPLDSANSTWTSRNSLPRFRVGRNRVVAYAVPVVVVVTVAVSGGASLFVSVKEV